jgi:hypothetical protein
MPAVKCCPIGHSPQKYAWGSQDKQLFCPVHTMHSGAVPVLLLGGNGTEQALAPVSRFVHMPDFACFQICTLQPS